MIDVNKKKSLLSKEGKMKTEVINKIVVFLIILMSFITSSNFNTLRANAEDKMDTLTGYLIDEHCFLKKSDDPGKETKKCLLMEKCAKSGYGIAVPDENGSYEFYYLDGSLITNFETVDATGGQKSAYDYINSTDKADHIKVTVSGSWDNNVKDSSDSNGTSYKVFNGYEIKDATDETSNEIKKISSMSKTLDESQEINYLPVVIIVAIVIAFVIVTTIYRNKKSEKK